MCWILDPDIIGCDVFDDLPDDIEPAQKSNKNAQDIASSSTISTTTNTPEKCVKTLPKRKSPLRRKSKQKEPVNAATGAVTAKNDTKEQLTCGPYTGGDSDAEVFEIEESDTPLIPLYHLRDEGTTKWVLLSDLCYLLKVKSKDTLLKLVSVSFCFFLFEFMQLLRNFNGLHFVLCFAFVSCIQDQVQRQMGIKKIYCENWRCRNSWKRPFVCSYCVPVKSWTFAHQRLR